MQDQAADARFEPLTGALRTSLQFQRRSAKKLKRHCIRFSSDGQTAPPDAVCQRVR